MKFWWLIEKGVEGALEAQYLTPVEASNSVWGADANKAMRFFRKEDADTFGSDPVFCSMPPLNNPHVSVEHGFDEGDE